MNCTGVGSGRAAGTGRTRLGSTCGWLPVGLRAALLKKCHSLRSPVGCSAHVPRTPPRPRPRPHLPRPPPAARPRPGSGDSSPSRPPPAPFPVFSLSFGLIPLPTDLTSLSYAIQRLSSQPSRGLSRLPPPAALTWAFCGSLAVLVLAWSSPGFLPEASTLRDLLRVRSSG